MYSSHHGAVGVAITVAGYSLAGIGGAVVAAPLAFYSHDLLDRIGEGAYGDLKASILWEGVPFAGFLFAALSSEIWGVFMLGWVMGNLMDLVDKRLYLSVLLHPRWITLPPVHTFSCHRRKPTIYLTRSQTKLATVTSTAFFVLAAFLL